MIYKINGTSLKMPAACTWGYRFLSSEESGRDTQNGEMSIDDVAVKRTLSGVSWAYPTYAEATAILQLLLAKRFMSIEYDDLLSGNRETRTFYCSDPSVPIYQWTVNQKICTSVGCDLVEK
jgi:hypothetical protein